MIKNILVIPCYNEETRLNQSEFLALAAQHPDSIFLFVNDGSTDETQRVLENLHTKANNCDVLKMQQNVGKAEAVRQGFLHALSEYDDVQSIAYYDADMATPYSDMRIMIDYLIENQKLLVSGCRFRRMGGFVERKFSRFILGRMFATAAATILRLPIYDTQCGAKVFSANAVQEIFNKTFISKWLFDVELFARLIEKYGYKRVLNEVYEFPLSAWYDIGGSKLNFKAMLRQPLNLLKIRNYYKDILKVRYDEYEKLSDTDKNER